MANTRTRRMLRITVPETATRDQVWKIFKQELQRRMQLSQETFLQMMQRVNPFVKKQFAQVIDQVWMDLYLSDAIRPSLMRRRGNAIHYYNVLNILAIIQQTGTIFDHDVTLKCLAEAVIIDPGQAETVFRGRFSYADQVNAKMVRMILRRKISFDMKKNEK